MTCNRRQPGGGSTFAREPFESIVRFVGEANGVAVPTKSDTPISIGVTRICGVTLDSRKPRARTRSESIVVALVPSLVPGEARAGLILSGTAPRLWYRGVVRHWHLSRLAGPPQDQSPDRIGAVPQPEDGRESPAQHLPQDARRITRRSRACCRACRPHGEHTPSIAHRHVRQATSCRRRPEPPCARFLDMVDLPRGPQLVPVLGRWQLHQRGSARSR
jgi:hypothetical protein